jgi:hypothetical protein
MERWEGGRRRKEKIESGDVGEVVVEVWGGILNTNATSNYHQLTQKACRLTLLPLPDIEIVGI